MRRFGAGCLLAGAVLSATCGWSQEEPAAELTAAEKERAEARLQFMMAALGRYELVVGDERTPAPLLPKPVLRWSNPVTGSGVQDGVVGVFTAGGRPAVLVQFAFHSKSFQVHEFYAVTTEPFEMLRGERSVWKPKESIFSFQDLTDAPAPAKSPALRLTQMRQLAAEFTVVDEFGWDKKEKQFLRLMPQPLHRYSDEARGVVDGAVFTFSMGTNPEANLLLEAVPAGDALKWQFAFSPMTIYALTATRNNVDVWQIGERKIFNSYDTPFRVGPYPRDPGEAVPD